MVILGDATRSVKCISVSKSSSKEAAAHKFFFPIPVRTAKDVALVALKKSWSPILWKEGIRGKINFSYCSYVVLDFDEGLDAEDAKNWFADHGYSFLLLLSKSHQIEKKTPGGEVLPPCDRFRVIIPASEPIRDIQQYEHNMKWWQKQLPADGSCHDGGRFFFPSPKLHFCNQGRSYDWQDFKEEIEKQEIIRANRRRHDEFYVSNGILPRRIRTILSHGAAVGSRHKTCYYLGAALAELGIPELSTIQMIMASSLGDIGEDEVREAVKYGRRKALGGSL